MTTGSGDPITSLAAAVPELEEVRRLAAAGDVDAVADRVLEWEHTRDHGQGAVAAQIVAGVDGVEHALERRLAHSPADLVARTLLAHRHVVIGWNVRSSLRAEHVTAEQFEEFHAWLRRAEQALIEVCAIQPGWTLAWHVRLITARGLELGLSETRRRYDRLAEHAPHHLPGQEQLLQRLCPKWGGTWDETFAFARERLAAAPPGSPVGSLVATAHLERWLDFDHDRERDAYVASADVRRELVAADEASTGHPSFDGGFHRVRAHSLFGVLHLLGGDEERALPHFRALGPYLDEGVWDYLGEKSRRRVNAVRTRAGGPR